MENDSEYACEIKAVKDRTMLGLAHDRVFGVFGMLFEIASDKIVIKWSRKAVNADGILTDPLTIGANKNVVQGVSACNILNCLKDNLTCFYIRALAIILEPTSWRTRRLCRRAFLMMRNAMQQPGRVTSCMRHRQHALFARFLAWL